MCTKQGIPQYIIKTKKLHEKYGFDSDESVLILRTRTHFSSYYSWGHGHVPHVHTVNHEIISGQYQQREELLCLLYLTEHRLKVEKGKERGRKCN